MQYFMIQINAQPKPLNLFSGLGCALISGYLSNSVIFLFNLKYI